VNKQLTDEEILEKYREVFECYAKDGVIDLDKRLKFSFFCQIRRLEQVVSLVIIPKRTIHSTLYESQQCKAEAIGKAPVYHCLSSCAGKVQRLFRAAFFQSAAGQLLCSSTATLFSSSACLIITSCK
jgi:hypothetical protein